MLFSNVNFNHFSFSCFTSLVHFSFSCFYHVTQVTRISLVSLTHTVQENQCSNAHSIVTKNLTRASRSNIGTLSKRFREIDLKNAEVEAKKKYHLANLAFMNWVETKVPKTTTSATATADIFTDEGRSLLLDAILSRENYTSARNLVEKATKSKNSANLIKPRTSSLVSIIIL